MTNTNDLPIDEMEAVAKAAAAGDCSLRLYSAAWHPPRALALIERLKAAQAAPDLTWFWEIVDAAGLADVPSVETEALRILVKKAGETDALRQLAAENARLREALEKLTDWVESGSIPDAWESQPDTYEDRCIAEARAALAAPASAPGTGDAS